MTTTVPVPAATCVLLRENEAPGQPPQVFLVRRHTRASFMAGAYVFPGGRVDAADLTADSSWCDGLDAARAHWPDLSPADAVGYHVAAARELFEEAGVLLVRTATGDVVTEADTATATRIASARAALHNGEVGLKSVIVSEGLRLALDALRPLAHWVTPEIETKRFDARFFATRVPEGQAARHDALETTHGVWMTAADALERCHRGEIALPPPTWSTLSDLVRFGSVEAILASTRDRAIYRREPRFFQVEGVPMLVVPGDPLYPAPEAERMNGVHAETRFILEGTAWRATRA